LATGLTGGQLLAAQFKAAYNIVRAQDPTAPIYTWSDMFDPNHNAVNNYYLWGSTIAGSSSGLPSDVTTFNWNLDNLPTSLACFSGLDNPQLISGYYDSGDGYPSRRQAGGNRTSAPHSVPAGTIVVRTRYGPRFPDSVWTAGSAPYNGRFAEREGSQNRLRCRTTR
jgi:hypothetical protein